MTPGPRCWPNWASSPRPSTTSWPARSSQRSRRESHSAVRRSPARSEKTREEKRFLRSDHDKNGAISRDEFLAARRRNFGFRFEARGLVVTVVRDVDRLSLFELASEIQRLSDAVQSGSASREDLSVERAREVYRVEVDVAAGAVDKAATRALRHAGGEGG